ncbi:hypothetical protein ACQP25_25770 [Microtetraspora malaysiensis]|uniref:hypothetical protein n=1 Tax=Microtetraspora malaysiensis TaxID=161358 RepID=UPI003D91F3A9
MLVVLGALVLVSDRLGLGFPVQAVTGAGNGDAARRGEWEHAFPEVGDVVLGIEPGDPVGAGKNG